MAAATIEAPVEALVRSSRLLFVDTSSLLDLVRDMTRDADLRRTVRAADALLAAALHDEIEILLPDQVEVELAWNLDAVEQESDLASKRHWRHGRAVEGELVELGLATGATIPDVVAERDVLENVRDLRRARLDEWRVLATVLKTGQPALARAVDRVNARQPPAHETKAEFADCLIIESVFEEIGRRGGKEDIGRAVFLSSNTRDYGEKGSSTVLRPPLDEQFERHGLRYAASFWHAEHLLAGSA